MAPMSEKTTGDSQPPEPLDPEAGESAEAPKAEPAASEPQVEPGDAPPPTEEAQEEDSPEAIFDRRFQIGLAVATLVAFLPALRGAFVWGDDVNIVRNGNLRDAAGLARIWTDPGSSHPYSPLTQSSFWLSFAASGLEPFGYHLFNVLLHITGALLFYRCLKRLQVRAAALAAGLFALHPLNAESVAWISQRQNVLSGALSLGACLLYLRYDEAAFGDPPAGENDPAEPVTEGSRRRLWLGALGLFILALAAKPAVAVVAPALLVVLWLIRGRRGARLFTPLAPFLGLGVVAGIAAAWLERSNGASGPDFDWTLGFRLAVAGRAFFFYLAKVLFPTNLTFLYPRWDIHPASASGILYPLAAAALLGGAIALRKRIGRGALAGLLCYGILLFPALGFYNFEFMRYAFVQNQLAYLATLPAVALLAAGGDLALQRLGGLRTVVAGAVLAVATGLTALEALPFKGYEELLTAGIERNPEAWLAAELLGDYYLEHERLPDAYGMYAVAILARPKDPGALTGMGVVMSRGGRFADGIKLLEEAKSLRPEHAETRFHLAGALDLAGRPAEATRELREALRLRPDWPAAQRHLAWILATSPDEKVRDGKAAVELATAACAKTTVAVARCQDTLAAAYAASGDFEKAQTTALNAADLAQKEPAAAARYAAHAKLFGSKQLLIWIPARQSPPGGPAPVAPIAPSGPASAAPVAPSGSASAAPPASVSAAPAAPPPDAGP